MDASELRPTGAHDAEIAAGYRVVSPVPSEVWHSLAVGNPNARIFQTHAWMRAVCAAGPYRDVSRMYVAPDGRVLVLPLARHRFVPFAASMPHGWGPGGLLAREPERPDDVAACVADLRALGVAKVSVTPDPIRLDAWVSTARVRRDVRATHVVDLAAGFEAFWSKVLDSSMRAKVRRAQRLGVEVERDATARGIDVFYSLYLAWLEERATRRGLPRSLIRLLGRRRDPRRKFETLRRSLGDGWCTWIARHDGRPIAAAIALTHGEHAVYFRGTSDREAVTRTRANELLQARMIEDACARGCRWYDMGESSGVESLIHFKRRFGAVERQKIEFAIESRAATIAAAAQDAARAASQPVRRRFG